MKIISRRVTTEPSYEDSDLLRRLIQNIDTCLLSPEAKIFKNDHTSIVGAVCVDECWFVVKQYYPRNRIRELCRSFIKSRAEKTWEGAHFLRSIGIDTVTPIALVEDKMFGFRLRSFFISDFIQGTTARSFFSDPENSVERKKQIAHEIMCSINALHSHGSIHGDTKDVNISVDGGSIKWFDLDSFSRCQTPFLRSRKKDKDWMLLLYNWREHPGIQKIFIQEMACFFTREYIFRIFRQIIRRRRKKLRSEPIAGRTGKMTINEFFRERALRKELRNSRILRSAGLYTADVIYSEKEDLIRVSEIQYGQSLDTYLQNAEKKADRSLHRKILRTIGEETGHIHGCGFIHKNLRSSNIFITYKDGSPKVTVTCNKDIKHYRTNVPHCKVLADLAKLDKDIRDLLSPTDRLRILIAYELSRGRSSREFRQKLITDIQKLSRAKI